jgi:formylglycine-generating enzyme required for sulfatase activity/nucleoside phosphorylase
LFTCVKTATPFFMTTSLTPPVIVLITVNDHETHAVLDAFLGAGLAPESVAKGGVTYFDLGQHGGNHIIHTVCEMGAGGVGASQQRTRDAIDHWQPRAVIAVGIGFGMDESKQAIGDVLVSTQIQDYELGRLNHDGTVTPRGDKPGSADNLRNRLRQVDIAEGRRAKGWPKVRFGLVLCGQKLVDNLDYRQSLKSLFTEAIGGEMEGSGVYAAVSAKHVDWIVIKAICDWGHDKNHAEKDAWQILAANNAARVLKTALDLGGLYAHASNAAKLQGHVPPPVPERGSAPQVQQSPTQALADAPAWAVATGRDSAGGYALAPNPWSAPVRVAWPAQVGEQVLWQQKFAAKGELCVTSFMLALDQIGLFARLAMQNKNGDHFTQVFRYILPGQFVMGSPEAEIDRNLDDDWFKNQLPQHTVTIGAGFWLADTACTQAAWHTVMGNNPSHFNAAHKGGSQHPVECVSWHDVQGFLQKLEPHLSVCHTSLPTEAEWEYACRAGSKTPFWFGATINTKQVNYWGDDPFSKGEDGEYRKQTAAVKDLPANGLGLYQMHGNVWEWCADPLREYRAQAQRDPGLIHASAPELAGEAVRVLRGGGWDDSARYVRSAWRALDRPGRLGGDIGFRLALRSKSQTSEV